MPLRKKQGCDVSSKVASNESEVHFKLKASRISGSCLPLNEEIDVVAPVDLPLAPSVILRHKVMSVSELRRVLKEWMREEIRYPSNENDDLYYSDCGNNTPVADLSLSRKEALISYAIWLVFSNQLDKVRIAKNYCMLRCRIFLFEVQKNVDLTNCIVYFRQEVL